jgi:hypothetical protein
MLEQILVLLTFKALLMLLDVVGEIFSSLRKWYSEERAQGLMVCVFDIGAVRVTGHMLHVF